MVHMGDCNYLSFPFEGRVSECHELLVVWSKGRVLAHLAQLDGRGPGYKCLSARGAYAVTDRWQMRRSLPGAPVTHSQTPQSPILLPILSGFFAL